MKYIEGNLLDFAEQGKFDYIIHGANCFCTFGSGIARQIKDRYPKAFMVDQLTQKGDDSKLGKFTQAYIDTTFFTRPEGKHTHPINPGGSGFTVINAYSLP